MGTTYALLIQEDVAQLHAAEKAARDKSRTDRVRLLRFVKEGRVPGIVQAAAALGYSVRTAERWWRRYCEGGLAALLAPPRRRGMVERITPEAWEGLQAEMQAWPRRWAARGPSLPARHLAHRLRHRRHLQAVPAAQGQAEDGPPAPPQGRQPRRAGGI
jgi:hypothetical protein